nr:NADH dehydrogenase subunit 1 [Haplotrema minimum]
MFYNFNFYIYYYYYLFIFNFMSSIILSLCVLLAVAFYTLLERKILGYVQIRKGPNKVGIMGMLQPISDAVKLFLKENIIPMKSNSLMFILLPIFGLSLSLFIWGLCPSEFQFKYLMYNLLMFLCISALNVYVVMGAGWVSNSLYAFLGSLRASAQSISYEISLVVLILFPVMMIISYDFFYSFNKFPIILISIMLSMIWFTTSLAETNRAPFDFAEGESELVSGFNIEYQSGLFAILFLAEYCSILFMSAVTVIWFLMIKSTIIFIFMVLLISVMFLISRGVFPRYRYDLLMMLCWKSFLPISLSYLMLVNFLPMCFS